MKRDIESLTSQEFDLLIIGGGIYGIACARDAVLRGLNVALVERQDFGGQTSANSAKVAHCGMRYLQHLDFKRMRESIRERNTFQQIAPHLIQSQAFIMPVYGHGIKGKESLTLYMKMYDLLSPERKKFKDTYRCVPDSKILAKDEVLNISPGVDKKGLTGGALWYEGQIVNTERFSFSTLRSAVDHGAVAANYVEVEKICNEGKRVTGVVVRDLIHDQKHLINARYILNAAGPWSNKIFELSDLSFQDYGIYASKAFCLITKRVTGKHALTFPIQQMYKDKSAVVNKGSSLQFAIPWRDKTIFASMHLPCDENPENVTITEEDISNYINMINEGFPEAKLSRTDIDHVLWGVIPAEEKQGAAPLKHYKIIDHFKEDGITGFATVVGVKYTTSRDVAEKTINMIEDYLRTPEEKQPCTTLTTPLWGGKIEYYEEFIKQALNQYGDKIPEEVLFNLIQNFGSEFYHVADIIIKSPETLSLVGNSNVTTAQLIYSLREEMVERLSDIVLRRTELGSHQYPGDSVINACARIAAKERGWSEHRTQNEIDMVKSCYLNKI